MKQPDQLPEEKWEEDDDFCQGDEVNTDVLTTKAHGIVSGYTNVCNSVENESLPVSGVEGSLEGIQRPIK